MPELHEPIHPGEILLEEFLNPLAISQYRLAVPAGARHRRAASPHLQDRAR